MLLSTLLIFVLILASSSGDFQSVELEMCGLTTVQEVASWRIFGGQNVTNEHPWAVLIVTSEQVATGDGSVVNKSYSCSGTLINQQWIITSASCVANQNRNQSLNPNQIKAHLGPYAQSPDKETIFLRPNVSISSVVVHPDFWPLDKRWNNDVALLNISDSIVIETAEERFLLNGACLPRQAPGSGLEYTIVGFGKLGFSQNTGYQLVEVDNVKLVDDCRTLIKEFLEETNDNFNQSANVDVIAESISGMLPLPGRGYCSMVRQESACSGDNGGPLLLQRPDQRYELTAIISNSIEPVFLSGEYSEDLKQRLNQTYPCGISDIFHDVYLKIGWILDTMDPADSTIEITTTTTSSSTVSDSTVTEPIAGESADSSSTGSSNYTTTTMTIRNAVTMTIPTSTGRTSAPLRWTAFRVFILIMILLGVIIGTAYSLAFITIACASEEELTERLSTRIVDADNGDENGGEKSIENKNRSQEDDLSSVEIGTGEYSEA